jgi:hypothetical protein
MQPEYLDIRSRIAAQPDWFDEHGVPRYGNFHPSATASIYVTEVALAEVTCQFCKRPFRVALSHVNFRASTIAEAIASHTLDYGDPPNVRCCGAGPMSNSIMRRTLEYWHRHDRRFVDENNKVKPDFSRVVGVVSRSTAGDRHAWF